jgi:hypothetical protein
MVALSALWLPTLLAAVFVFIVSSILHTVLTYHRSDCLQLPEEDKLMAAMRAAGVHRGYYMFPYCLPKEMKSPAAIEKFKAGPVGTMTVIPSGPPVMPKFLGLWFGFCLTISFFVAYLTGRTVAPGAPFLGVLRVASTAAFLAYGVGQLSNGIWKGQPWSMTLKEFFDGLLYALVTGAAFAWLWPH